MSSWRGQTQPTSMPSREPLLARRLVGQRVGHQLGQRIPLRRRPAELLRVVDRQAFEALLLAGGAVQVEQHQPGFGVLVVSTGR
jgi:hypothetical protein